jgi:outer membrane protein assembly factor BamB
VQIAAIMDDVVLVESSGSDEGSRHTLTAVDVASGEELWTRRPGTLVAAADDTVVLSTTTSIEPGSLIAVDAGSGAVRWSGPRGIATADLVGVHEDTLTLVTSPADDSSPELVSLSTTDGSLTGRSATRFAGWRCHPAEDPVVVCSLPGERAVGFDLETGKEIWELPTAGRYGVWVSSVRGGYVYGFTSGGRSVVLDAANGRDVTETAGASPVSSNGFGGLVLYSGQAIFYPADPEQIEPPQ